MYGVEINVLKPRTFKNKDLKMRDKLEYGFNFTFADACRIFISMNKTKYIVCWIGFDLCEEFVLFNKDAIHRHCFKSLFNAIQFFIYLQNMVTQDLSWYKPEIFEDSDQFYNFAHSEVFE